MKRILVFLGIIALALSLSGCAIIYRQPKAITVVDDMGREVNLAKTPERIISLGPTNTEFLFALGLADKIVGVTNICNYPEEAANKEKIGDFANPSLEKIVSLKPDLVVAASLHKEVVERLDSLNIPVIVLDAKSISQIFSNADLLGKATGTTKAAEAIKKRIDDTLKLVDEKIKGIPQENRPTVYYEVWFDPIMTAGPNTFIHELITRAGGVNLAANASTNYPTYSLEEILARQPDIMFYGHAVESVEGVLARANWSAIPAIAEQKVYLLNEDLIMRAGPRVGEGLLELARHIHPTLWK